MTRADRKYFQKEAAKAAKRAKGNWFKRQSLPVKFLIVFLSLGLIAAGAFAAVTYFYLDKQMATMNSSIPSLVEFDERELSCVDVDGYANILLIGIDARDINNPDGSRGDAIIIASIEEETGKISLTSIYRDTYLKLGGNDFYDKITHSFSYGGAKAMIKTINEAMDLNISKYVMFNFKAVSDVVDALGGLELNIEDYEINELNKYANETANIIGAKMPRDISKPGKQKLVGPQVVSYGRIRKGVGDDFKRADRMRIVIAELLKRVRTLSLKEMDGLVNLAVPQIQTNLSTNDVLALAMHMSKYHIGESTGFPYTLSTGYLNDVSYVFPNNLYDDVVALHEKVFNQKSYAPSERVIEMSNQIRVDIGIANNQTEVNVDEYYQNPYEQPDLLQSDVGAPIEIPDYSAEEYWVDDTEIQENPEGNVEEVQSEPDVIPEVTPEGQEGETNPEISPQEGAEGTEGVNEGSEGVTDEAGEGVGEGAGAGATPEGDSAGTDGQGDVGEEDGGDGAAEQIEGEPSGEGTEEGSGEGTGERTEEGTGEGTDGGSGEGTGDWTEERTGEGADGGSSEGTGEWIDETGEGTGDESGEWREEDGEGSSEGATDGLTEESSLGDWSTGEDTTQSYESSESESEYFQAEGESTYDIGEGEGVSDPGYEDPSESEEG